MKTFVYFPDFVANATILSEIEERWDELAPHLLDYNYTIPQEKKVEVGRKIKDFYLKGKPVSPDTTSELTQASIRNQNIDILVFIPVNHNLPKTVTNSFKLQILLLKQLVAPNSISQFYGGKFCSNEMLSSCDNNFSCIPNSTHVGKITNFSDKYFSTCL